jgi:hypothetical protein
MQRMLIVMAALVFLLGCKASDSRSEFRRGESCPSNGGAAPAATASRATPRPETRSAALPAPAGRGTPVANAPRVSRPAVSTTSAAGREYTVPERPDAAAEKQVFEGINGLVIDETMTKVGRAFFEQFCLLWEAPTTGLTGYNVIIMEKASPLWGTWITVSVDDVPVRRV